MNREVETIREKVHTTADAALFLCFQEVKGSHSKGVIRLPLLHYDIPFEGYGEMLLRMNRIYDLLGMPDAGSCMRSLSEGEKEEWEFTDEMKNNQDTTLLGENQFSIDNPVDTGSAGVYEVTYTATAEDGQTSSVRLIVCVNE